MMRAPLTSGAIGNGGPIAPGDRHGGSIGIGGARKRLLCLLVASWVVAFEVLPVAGQDGVDGEVEDLLGSIQQSQDKIVRQAKENERLGESRLAIDQLLDEADLTSLAGDNAAALADIGRAKALLVDGDTSTPNRILLAEATIAIRMGNLAEAHRLLDDVRRSTEISASQANRLSTLDSRVADKSKDAADRAAKERARAELDALEAMPLDQAIAAAALIYEARPTEDIGISFARLLMRDWRWDEAEAIYAHFLPPGTSLAEHERTAVGLVDLYMRTNRLAEANALLTQLEVETQPVAADSRTAVLRSRIDEALAPNQLSGSVGLRAGYESNVPGAISIEDDGVRKRDSDEDIPSGVIGELVRLRYGRVVTPNGDQVFLQGGIEDFRYFNTSVSRTNFDARVGYLHFVPASTTEWEALVGYKARFVDFDSYRRTAYGAFTIDHDVSRTLALSGALLVEANDDDDDARDSIAVGAEGEVGVAVSERDALAAGLSFRYEDARADSESRVEIRATLAWERDFTFLAKEGYFVKASYSPSYVHYLAAKRGEPVREDFTHRLSATVGRDINDFWTADLTGTYSIRNSNIRSKRTESGRVLFTLSRRFDETWN